MSTYDPMMLQLPYAADPPGSTFQAHALKFPAPEPGGAGTAKTETVKITYKGSVKPAKTTFLAPAEISMDFEGTLDLVDSDIANAKAVQKAF